MGGGGGANHGVRLGFKGTRTTQKRVRVSPVSAEAELATTAEM